VWGGQEEKEATAYLYQHGQYITRATGYAIFDQAWSHALWRAYRYAKTPMCMPPRGVFSQGFIQLLVFACGGYLSDYPGLAHPHIGIVFIQLRQRYEAFEFDGLRTPSKSIAKG